MNLLKRIYSFITRANQVLFFIGICVVLIAVGFALYREIFRPTYYNPGPQVSIENPEQGKDPSKPSATITDVDVLYRDEVTTIIGIWKSQIQKPNGDKAAVFGDIGVASAASSVAKQARMYGGRGALVNLRIFKTGSSTFRNLLPSDGLIVSNDYDLRRYAPQQFKTLAAFIFEVVTDDTNNDSMLTAEDDRTLILVDRSQEKPDLKIPNYMSYGYSSPGKIVVKTKTKDEVRFLEVELTTFKTSEIPWQ